jgi:ABC-2 type transport system permease protein
VKNRVGSSGRPSRTEVLGPFWAIAHADLRGLFKSRITFGWLLTAVLIQVVRVLGSRSAGTTSTVVSSGLADFTYIWSLVIIGLAASSVSSETGELADSILSKSVTRLDYVLAKFASRIAYTLVCYLVVTGVLAGMALRLDVGDYDALGLILAILVVALTMVVLTGLGVAFSITMPNTVIAIVTLLVLWYSMTIFFPVVGLDALSPGSLLSRLPDIVKGAWGWKEWESVAGFVAILGGCVALSSAYFNTKDI